MKKGGEFLSKIILKYTTVDWRHLNQLKQVATRCGWRLYGVARLQDCFEVYGGTGKLCFVYWVSVQRKVPASEIKSACSLKLQCFGSTVKRCTARCCTSTCLTSCFQQTVIEKQNESWRFWFHLKVILM